MYRQAATVADDEIFLSAGQMGMGWWSDAWDEVKSVAKKVQKNPVVRGIEKKAVNYGTKALRGVAEGAVDTLADSALTTVGLPELAPMADKLIDKGASYLQHKGADYLKQKIDASGSGVRYMSPAGGGMRLAGRGTTIGAGMRLAGSGEPLLGKALLALSGNGKGCSCGSGLRLAGSGHCGNGMRLAGSGARVPAGRYGLIEGTGQGVCA